MAARYCQTLVNRALEGFRAQCTNTAAAASAGVDESTIRKWRKAHPEFEREVQAVTEEFFETSGREAVLSVFEHIQAARRGEMVLTKSGIEAGKQVELLERVQLNPALIRLAVTKFSPSHTHPPKQLDAGRDADQRAAIDEANALIAAQDPPTGTAS